MFWRWKCDAPANAQRLEADERGKVHVRRLVLDLGKTVTPLRHVGREGQCGGLAQDRRHAVWLFSTYCGRKGLDESSHGTHVETPKRGPLFLQRMLSLCFPQGLCKSA